MKLATPAGTVHLTYCTNIHRGESWNETFAALVRAVPSIKTKVSAQAAMGLGLRLSAAAARALLDPEPLQQLRTWLTANDLYVFTLNGFPYGAFHGTRVKERVYEPDWRAAERVAYTRALAELLATLLPDEPGVSGSISTVPLGFRPRRFEPTALEQMAANLIEILAELIALERKTGKTVALALEPEPMCALETTAEAVSFLEEYLLVRPALARLAERTGLAPAATEAALRRLVGICFDVCHAAVEFEDPQESLDLIARHGLSVPKIQLSAALRVPAVDLQTAAMLSRFDDGVYLHQVVERAADGTLRRFLDLPEALAALDAARGREWRIHCHVPIFASQFASNLLATQPELEAVLACARERLVSPHLEVETYTFEVLPEELRADGLETAVARELLWARSRLLA